MKPKHYVDFGQLSENVRQPQKGRHDLCILGGQCPEKEILSFLEQWDLTDMPYRIWEYASEIAFAQNTFPDNYPLLERGRLFGTGGDLSLRRNIGSFEWRFIGPAGIQPPTGDYHVQDFWDRDPKTGFHQYEKTALLWGAFDGQRWAENRVAAAHLDYPVKEKVVGSRIKLSYKVFCRAGHVEFVWYTGLGEWRESSDD